MRRKLIKDLYSTTEYVESLHGEHRTLETELKRMRQATRESCYNGLWTCLLQHIIRLEHYKIFFYVLILT